MTDQEKYELAIRLAETAGKLSGTHLHSLVERLAEAALELLREKKK
jgi:hypothetical protein